VIAGVVGVDGDAEHAAALGAEEIFRLLGRAAAAE
jgi:hypothetical protein